MIGKHSLELLAARCSQCKGLSIGRIGKTRSRSEELKELGAEAVLVYR